MRADCKRCAKAVKAKLFGHFSCFLQTQPETDWTARPTFKLLFKPLYGGKEFAVVIFAINDLHAYNLAVSFLLGKAVAILLVCVHVWIIVKYGYVKIIFQKVNDLSAARAAAAVKQQLFHHSTVLRIFIRSEKSGLSAMTFLMLSSK